ncbi:peptide chain release factor N(5)-glutamine methyltransferase [Candidatus Peregrinibacteria bacterium]|nr:peptide chain release factor N(5)-glutamine methyltransferase [Candidatus Peregrinibacteria bacterium]
MTIKELLKQAVKGSGSRELLGIELLLAHALKIERKDLITKSNDIVKANDIVTFQKSYFRFKKGEPVEHILGFKEFYGMPFKVNDKVLIPRPETEHLVEYVLKLIEGGGVKSALDVGTGSGCIAISIASNSEATRVAGCDVSLDALNVARENNATLANGMVELFQSDLLSDVSESFDVIVANLPYIGTEKFNFVSDEAKRYEPEVALFGGTDGLTLYEKLFEQIVELTERPKYLIGEFGFLQGDHMRALLNKYFEQYEWEIIKDYASIERMFVVTFASL